MKISKRTWKRYKNKLAAVSKKAADEMERYLKRIGGYDVDPDAVIRYAYALATKYGEAAAAAACEMYDAVASISGANVPRAEPAATATYSETARAVRGTVKNGSQILLPSTAGRLVKQAGADTTLLNAKRDRAQFAWIPSGDSCVFCQVIASRGWQPASKAVMRGDHAEHIHANCDCQFAIRFNTRTSYSGYDPERYLEEYEDAEGYSSKDKINYLRRKQYAEAKDEINAQKRMAYARRRELETELDED